MGNRCRKCGAGPQTASSWVQVGDNNGNWNPLHWESQEYTVTPQIYVCQRCGGEFCGKCVDSHGCGRQQRVECYTCADDLGLRYFTCPFCRKYFCRVHDTPYKHACPNAPRCAVCGKVASVKCGHCKRDYCYDHNWTWEHKCSALPACGKCLRHDLLSKCEKCGGFYCRECVGYTEHGCSKYNVCYKCGNLTFPSNCRCCGAVYFICADHSDERLKWCLTCFNLTDEQRKTKKVGVNREIERIMNSRLPFSSGTPFKF